MENRNSLGLFLAAGAVFFFCRLIFPREAWSSRRIFVTDIIGFLFLSIILFNNGSKGALVSAGLGIILGTLIKLLKRHSLRVLILSFLSLIFVLVFSTMLLILKPIFLGKIKNIGFRYEAFDATIELCRNNLLFGHGPNQLNAVLPLTWNPYSIYYEGVGDSIFHAHNEWLQLLFEYGLLGLLLFVLFLGVVLVRQVKLIQDNKSQFTALYVYTFLGILMVLFQCSFDRIFRFPSVWLLFIGYLFLHFNKKEKILCTAKSPKLFLVLLGLFYAFFVSQVLWPQRDFTVAMKALKSEDIIMAEKLTSKIASSEFNVEMQIKSLVASGNLNKLLKDDTKVEFISNRLKAKNPILIYPYMLLINLHLGRDDAVKAEEVLLNYNQGIVHLDLFNYYLSKRVQSQIKLDHGVLSLAFKVLNDLNKAKSLPYPSKITSKVFTEYCLELISFFENNGYKEYSQKTSLYVRNQFNEELNN